MKNLGDTVLWTEERESERDMLKRALDSATMSVQEAIGHCYWDGVNLISKNTISDDQYRHLYFYLSGYGDCQYQHSRNHETP